MKRQYSQPQMTKVGSLTRVTRAVKDLGLFDGDYFKNQDNTLVDVSA